MRANEAKKLGDGERVMWGTDPNDLGTVIDNGYLAITVRWDNGQTGTIHHDDCGVISRHSDNPEPWRRCESLHPSHTSELPCQCARQLGHSGNHTFEGTVWRGDALVPRGTGRKRNPKVGDEVVSLKVPARGIGRIMRYAAFSASKHQFWIEWNDGSRTWNYPNDFRVVG